MKINLTRINKEADVLGLLFIGDGSKSSRTTLLNIMVSGKFFPVSALELVDCQGHLEDFIKNMEPSYVVDFLIIQKQLIQLSPLMMLLCLMEIHMYKLEVIY